MKVIEGTPSGKAALVRAQRHQAYIARQKAKVYRRLDRWKEAEVGSDKEEHQLFLKTGWSFDHDKIVQMKKFCSVHEAMVGLNMTYPVVSIKKEDSAKRKLVFLRRQIVRQARELRSVKSDIAELLDVQKSHNDIVVFFKDRAAVAEVEITNLKEIVARRELLEKIEGGQK